MAQTIAERMALCSNRPAGFDYLRLALASFVVLSHETNVVYGEAATHAVWRTVARVPLASLMPLFFALSGFLVAGSLERCKTMISFIGLRLLRLLPALTVDTCVAAFIIGPIFTSLNLAEYLVSRETWVYLLNITGRIHYHLPGVFDHNPWPNNINGQLWTLPGELRCYEFLTLMAIIGLLRNRLIFLVATLLYMIWVFVADGMPMSLAHQELVTIDVLVESFMIGVTLFLYRDIVPLNKYLFVASTISLILLLLTRTGDYMVAIPAAYIIVYLGMLNPRRVKIIESGDYSYGIFLYGMPIQQSVIAVTGVIPWPIHLIISYSIIIGIAFLSWNFVEKPALLLRKKLYSFESWATAVAFRIPFGIHLVQPAHGPRLARPPARS